MTAARAPRATDVSRHFRAQGITTLPSGTRPGVHGVRVTDSRATREVSVTVTHPTRTGEARIAAAVLAALQADGYDVHPNALDGAIMSVTRPEQTR